MEGRQSGVERSRWQGDRRETNVCRIRRPGEGPAVYPNHSAEDPLIPAANWEVLGKAQPKVGGRDFVTGKHRYPSDQTLPGMWYGKVLRPPAFGATLVSIDTTKAEQLGGVRRPRRQLCRRSGSKFSGCVVRAVLPFAPNGSPSLSLRAKIFLRISSRARRKARTRAGTVIARKTGMRSRH